MFYRRHIITLTNRSSMTADGRSCYVGGEWIAPDGGPIEVENPATESVVERLPSATPETVARACEAAAEAQTEWARRTAQERGDLLLKIGDVIDENVDEIAPLLVEEQGKPVSTAQGEVAATGDLARYVAGWDRRLEGDIVPSDRDRESIHIRRYPVGVVAGIVPWNYPIAVLMRKLLPPLVAGNAVVLKPSEATPLSACRLVELLDDALDIPDGLINLVVGGPSVGAALVDDRNVDMVSMTGSTAAGKEIMRSAADSLTDVSLELGGKAPAIVLPDADIEDAVEHILTARITNTGQVCTCAECVYVHESVAEEFIEQDTDAMAAVEVGAPGDDPEMGPQVSAAEREKTDSAVQSAVKSGATVRYGGGRPEGSTFETGYWYEPTVLADVTQEMDVIQNEVFGPVMPIVTVDSAKEAVAYANESRYGLSSYVYTNDYGTAMRIAEDLEYGETYINRTLGESWQGYHTGWKESGVGGEDGKYGVRSYTKQKTIYHNYDQ